MSTIPNNLVHLTPLQINKYKNNLPRLLKKVEKNDPDAQFALATFYAKDPEVGIDLKKSKELYVKAIVGFKKIADCGIAEAHYNLGLMYLNALGVDKDEKKAYEHFMIAAKKFFPAAQYQVGVLCLEGRGLKENKEDIDSAIHWLNEAIKHNFTEALNALGIIYSQDKVKGEKNPYQKSFGLFEKAALQGNTQAKYNLGISYQKGLGVNANIETALKWLNEAANEGNINALFSLGTLYSAGEIVPQNKTLAVKYYHLAAERGHMDAQYNLGTYYEEGKNVAQDLNMARKWYGEAAKQGDVQAQKILNELESTSENNTTDDTTNNQTECGKRKLSDSESESEGSAPNKRRKI